MDHVNILSFQAICSCSSPSTALQVSHCTLPVHRATLWASILHKPLYLAVRTHVTTLTDHKSLLPSTNGNLRLNNMDWITSRTIPITHYPHFCSVPTSPNLSCCTPARLRGSPHLLCSVSCNLPVYAEAGAKLSPGWKELKQGDSKAGIFAFGKTIPNWSHGDVSQHLCDVQGLKVGVVV